MSLMNEFSSFPSIKKFFFKFSCPFHPLETSQALIDVLRNLKCRPYQNNLENLFKGLKQVAIQNV